MGFVSTVLAILLALVIRDWVHGQLRPPVEKDDSGMHVWKNDMARRRMR